jgi:intein/homing endonuclease
VLTAEVYDGTSVDLMATISEYNSKFQEFTMSDDGQNGDAVTGDNIYSASLPFQSSGLEVKFYIRSENNDAIKLNPERAEYEFYTYSPTTSILEATFTEVPILIKITDILGRTITPTHNTPLFYIYSDGSVEKRFIVR